MMTKSEAVAIADVISTDPEASKRIDSCIPSMVPDSWGISGGIRNAGYIALEIVTLGKMADPTEKEYADRVCTGISDSTAAAINAAVAGNDPRLRNVLGADAISRNLHGVVHYATKIKMRDGQEHVFDWHSTLNAKDSMMYKTTSDWLNGSRGSVLKDFSGWN